MMFRSRALILIFLTSMVSSAYAADPLSSGFYIGGSVGYTELDDDDDAFRGLDFDDSDFGYGILAGYKFFDYFAVEARFTDTGDYDVENIDYETDILSVHAIGILPFDNGWSLYGQVGVGEISIEIDPNDEDETVVSAGFGAMYHASRDLSFALQADAYQYETDIASADDSDFLLSTFQFVIRYTF